MDERDRERQEQEEKKQRVLIVGAMKSGNPFQLMLGKGSVADTAARVKRSLEEGGVEIIAPAGPKVEQSGTVIIRWAEMESCVVMTEFEMERRSLLQSMAGRRASGQG